MSVSDAVTQRAERVERAPTGTDVPREGEACSCGRPALTVYVTEEFGRVGYCGRA